MTHTHTECLMTQREEMATRRTATAAPLVILKKDNKSCRGWCFFFFTQFHFSNLQWPPDAFAPVISSILLLSCSHLCSLRCCASTCASMSYLAQGYAETDRQSENRLGVWPFWPEKSLSGTNLPNNVRATLLYSHSRTVGQRLAVRKTQSLWASEWDCLFVTLAMWRPISLEREAREKRPMTEEDSNSRWS